MPATTLTEAAEKLKPLLEALPRSDRIGLAQYLWDTVEESEAATEEEIRAAWKAEILRRLDDAKSGKDPGTPAEEVHRRLREEFS